jgi:hypothetical protein
MGNIKIINGEKYSKDNFKGYTYRVKVDFHTISRRHSIDLYTTRSTKDLIWEDIHELITDKVVRFEIIHFSTKEQDDSATELINEWLNEK